MLAALGQQGIDAVVQAGEQQFPVEVGGIGTVAGFTLGPLASRLVFEQPCGGEPLPADMVMLLGPEGGLPGQLGHLVEGELIDMVDGGGRFVEVVAKSPPAQIVAEGVAFPAVGGAVGQAA